MDTVQGWKFVHDRVSRSSIRGRLPTNLGDVFIGKMNSDKLNKTYLPKPTSGMVLTSVIVKASTSFC